MLRIKAFIKNALKWPKKRRKRIDFKGFLYNVNISCCYIKRVDTRPTPTKGLK